MRSLFRKLALRPRYSAAAFTVSHAIVAILVTQLRRTSSRDARKRVKRSQIPYKIRVSSTSFGDRTLGDDDQSIDLRKILPSVRKLLMLQTTNAPASTA